MIIRGTEREGMLYFHKYADHIETDFFGLLASTRFLKNQTCIGSFCPEYPKNDSNNSGQFPYNSFTKQKLNEETEDFLLSFLLSETQGGIRTNTKLVDLTLAMTDLKGFDEKFRFRLGVGLAKLGLHDLSLRHVGLAATPWESPLYRLRAKLVFAPVHSSIGALASAVNNFERQLESILMQNIPQTSGMLTVCNSLNEAALALQALPLLHVIGYSSPRVGVALGHLPMPLPLLLGEVYLNMCPLKHSFDKSLISRWMNLPIDATSDIINADGNKFHKLRIGIVAGSFDGIPGRIMIGMLDAFPEKLRRVVEFTAMCFPTPRSAVTDKVNAIFDHHVNLPPENKTQVIERISNAQVDVLLFADAAMDARVFALAHERFAEFQGILWSWGGTLGIPTIDYYFIPEMFLRDSRCPYGLDGGKIFPQEIFREQVVLLEGVPDYPRMAALSDEDARGIMKARYLLDIGNRTNIYLFPASVKHFHPEFDKAVEVIFRTDPLAVLILAVPKTGRDNLPTTHIAVRHDLLHPAMPIAAVAKLKTRLISAIKANPDRVRVLPPLDEQVFRTVLQQAVAVLDPYPVGLHVSIYEAMMDGIPVISAPNLQECTNSHTYSMARYLNIMQPSSPRNIHSLQESEFFPTSAEEYGVLAVRVAKESSVRKQFIRDERTNKIPTPEQRGKHSHLEQIVEFIQTLRKSIS